MARLSQCIGGVAFAVLGCTTGSITAINLNELPLKQETATELATSLRMFDDPSLSLSCSAAELEYSRIGFVMMHVEGDTSGVSGVKPTPEQQAKVAELKQRADALALEGAANPSILCKLAHLQSGVFEAAMAGDL
jgi:hypothetical protein